MERVGAAAVPPWVRREHEARYRFAAGYVRDRDVIDCACGTGLGIGHFLAAGAKRVRGFDVSQDALDEAARRVGGRAELALGSGLSLPVSSCSADVFISLETIEHIEDDRGFLREVARVLRPGGVFVCSTPNRTVTNPGLPPDGKPANPFHVREYSEDEFRTLLSRHFGSVKMFGQNPTPRVVGSVMRALGEVAPMRLATRLHQVRKFRYLLPPFTSLHEAREMRPDRWCECLIAVCTSSIA